MLEVMQMGFIKPSSRIIKIREIVYTSTVTSATLDGDSNENAVCEVCKERYCTGDL